MFRGFRGTQRSLRGLDPILGEADGVIGAFLERSGLAELEPAERAGLLTIDLLGIDPVEFLKSSIGLAVQRSGNPSVSAAAKVGTGLVTSRRSRS